jgi:glycosyltransferase involved in cell wall biosynthesis
LVTGVLTEDAARALAAAGDEVEVIAAGDGTPGGHDRDDLDLGLGPGVRVFRLPTLGRARTEAAAESGLFYGPGAPETLERGRGGARVRAWIEAAAFYAGLCRWTRSRRDRWDRIVAHWLVPSALAACAAAPGWPLVAHAHSGDVALLERLPAGPALARLIAGGASDIVFASVDLQGRFARLAGRRIGRVAPAAPPSAWARLRPGNDDGSDGAAALRLRARRELHLDGPTVLSVGRLVPIKGFDTFVRAAALVDAASRRGGRPRPTYVILGDGPERERLARFAAALDVELWMPGFVSRTEIGRWHLAADVYVQPSRPLANGRTEGTPVATLEALAGGLPVVASSTGGLAELAAATLRLVPAGDPRALAARLVDELARPPAPSTL